MQGSGILGTTAGEEVGLSGLPDRSSVVQLLDIGQNVYQKNCLVTDSTLGVLVVLTCTGLASTACVAGAV